MEEKKTNKLNNEMPGNETLNDEMLNTVSGGAAFIPPNQKKWCSHCQRMVLYRVVYEDRTTRYECLECNNPLEP